VVAYIGLGSNLDDPLTQVKTAIHALDQIRHSRCLVSSSCYRSPPMGPQDQPDYINAVAALATALPPHLLLQALQQIEQAHGRTRTRHWGERTLDLDLLLYGEQVINSADLVVPHPGISQRAFVLYPLQQIAPELQIPGQGSLATLAADCGRGKLQRLDQ